MFGYARLLERPNLGAERILHGQLALKVNPSNGSFFEVINTIQSWSHGFGARVASVSEGNYSLLGSPRSSPSRWGAHA